MLRVFSYLLQVKDRATAYKWLVEVCVLAGRTITWQVARVPFSQTLSPTKQQVYTENAKPESITVDSLKTPLDRVFPGIHCVTHLYSHRQHQPNPLSSARTGHGDVSDITGDAQYDTVRSMTERFIREAGLDQIAEPSMFANGKKLALRLDVCA